MIVVDTNVVVHALVNGDADLAGRQATEALRRDPEWAAPVLWRSEFCNVLGTQIRHGGLSPAKAASALADALVLLRPRERLVDPFAVLDMAVQSGCTAYDCEFVVLAGTLGVPLVTTDRAVLKAFPRVAVSLADFASHR
jgi:predicted nucleic acid-binding protein